MQKYLLIILFTLASLVAVAEPLSSSFSLSDTAASGIVANHKYEQGVGGTDASSIPYMSPADILKIRSNDIVLGNPFAKVVMIDYSSVTCAHCAEFAKHVFPLIKADFIDTNKIAFVKRLIPTNGPALKVSMLLECVNDKALRFRVIETLMKYQHEWLYDAQGSYTERLKHFADLAGVDADDFGRCIADEALGKQLYNNIIAEAKAINLTHSPMFFINGQVYSGTYDYEDVKKFIESFL